MEGRVEGILHVAGAETFSLPLYSHWFWCEPSFLSVGYSGHSPQLKQPKHKASH